MINHGEVVRNLQKLAWDAELARQELSNGIIKYVSDVETGELIDIRVKGDDGYMVQREVFQNRILRMASSYGNLDQESFNVFTSNMGVRFDDQGRLWDEKYEVFLLHSGDMELSRVLRLSSPRNSDLYTIIGNYDEAGELQSFREYWGRVDDKGPIQYYLNRDIDAAAVEVAPMGVPVKVSELVDAHGGDEEIDPFYISDRIRVSESEIQSEMGYEALRFKTRVPLQIGKPRDQWFAGQSFGTLPVFRDGLWLQQIAGWRE